MPAIITIPLVEAQIMAMALLVVLLNPPLGLDRPTLATNH